MLLVRGVPGVIFPEREVFISSLEVSQFGGLSGFDRIVAVSVTVFFLFLYSR